MRPWKPKRRECERTGFVCERELCALFLCSVTVKREPHTVSEVPLIAHEVMKDVRLGPPRKIPKLGAGNMPGPTDELLPGRYSTLPGEALNPGQPVTMRDFAAIAVEEDYDGQAVTQRNFERSLVLFKVHIPH